ncbi:MAG: hypothetical protein JWM19_7713 [Actinomycetia bacterium]|nr:hypothetical protein [Actinomycetes bacterium]
MPVLPIKAPNTIGGEAIHLAREAGSDEEGRDAVPDHYLEDFEQVYDISAIAAPRWLETTLCGRQWILMASGEDTEDDEAVFAPTCRRCLAIMDKLFPAPELDPRFPLVVQVVTDTVIEHGTAEILGVPGDHQAALRKDVRAAVRNRTGYGMETYAQEAMVTFVCQPIYDQHELEHARLPVVRSRGTPGSQPRSAGRGRRSGAGGRAATCATSQKTGWREVGIFPTRGVR